MASGKPAETHEEKETLAAEFALLVAENHTEVDDDIINVLKEKFSEKEISELCAFICFIIASQKFGAVLGLK